MAGQGEVFEADLLAGQLEPLDHLGILLGVAGKAAGPRLDQLIQMRGDGDGAVGESAAVVRAGSREAVGVVVHPCDAAARRIGPEPIENLEPPARGAEGAGLVVARAEGQHGDAAAAGQAAVGAHVATRGPGDGLRTSPGSDEENVIDDEIGQDRHRRQPGQHAIEGHAPRGRFDPLFGAGRVLGAAQILPAVQDWFALAVDDRRWAGPDHPTPRFGQLLHHGQQFGAGQRLELGRQGGEAAPGQLDAPSDHSAALDELVLGDVVGVSVEAGPASETLLGGHQVQRVEHEHVTIAVDHALNHGVLGGSSGPGRIGQSVPSAADLVGHAPVGGVRVGHPVEHTS